MVISNVTICDASGERQADVRIADGKIVEIGKKLSALESIDGHGAYLLPGLIDTNVHLKDNVLSSTTLQKSAKAALMGGVTTIVLSPYCTPAVADEISLEFVESHRDQPKGATIETAIATNDEDELLSNIAILLKRGALVPYMTTAIRNNVAFRIAEYVKMYQTTLFCKAQDTSLSSAGVMVEGKIATALGLVGIPPIGESVHVARMIEIARNFGIKILFKSVASPRSIEMISAAKAEGVAVSCEVSIHHLTHCDEACVNFNTVAKLSPPLATRENMQRLQTFLEAGEIDILTTLHQPNSPVNKEQAFADAAYGSSAISEALPLYYTKLVKSGLVDLPTLLALTADRPAQMLGLKCGRIEVGYDADMILFNPNAQTVVNDPQSLDNGAVLEGAISVRFHKGEMIAV